MSFRILVVDDDKSMRSLFGGLLESHGYHVRTASNGVEGLQVAADYAPHLILLDVHMPRMEGNKMLELLRGMAWGKGIKVILATAGTSLHSLPHVEQADELLHKPILTRELLKMVSRLLGQYHKEAKSIGEVVP